MLKEFMDCSTWDYTEMPGLSRELVEHVLPIKRGFRPFKQPARSFNPELLDRIKEEVERLLRAGFIRTCGSVEWISNIVSIEKRNTGKIRVCVDFRNLNKVTPKGEYPMPVAEVLINRALGHKMISFLDGNAGYNQIFMAKEDVFKMAFRCPGFVGLFEWVVMTVGLRNARATYQRAMNLIFHDLLGILLEVYMADLRIVFERMRKYNLKMNPLKFAFGVSAGWFLGFIVREGGIEIDPKKVESIEKLAELTCKWDVQKLLGKVNYLRRFIMNLAGTVESFLPLVRLKHEGEFKWGEEQKRAFDRIKEYLLAPPMLRAPKVRVGFRLYIAAQHNVIGAVLTQEDEG
jgi:hypothetical protein